MGLKYLEMDFTTGTFSKMLSEMGDLKELLSRGAASDPDISRRIESQKVALMAQLKEEYEDKLTNLENTIKKLTSVGKGKRYEKQLIRLKGTLSMLITCWKSWMRMGALQTGWKN